MIAQAEQLSAQHGFGDPIIVDNITIRVFTAATDPDVVGGEICGRDRPAELQAAYDLVATGELDDEFGAIKAQAYADG